MSDDLKDYAKLIYGLWTRFTTVAGTHEKICACDEDVMKKLCKDTFEFFTKYRFYNDWLQLEMLNRFWPDETHDLMQHDDFINKVFVAGKNRVFDVTRSAVVTVNHRFFFDNYELLEWVKKSFKRSKSNITQDVHKALQTINRPIVSVPEVMEHVSSSYAPQTVGRALADLNLVKKRVNSHGDVQNLWLFGPHSKQYESMKSKYVKKHWLAMKEPVSFI